MSHSHGWRYIYASVVGKAHLESGIPCQDASRVVLEPAADGGGVLILVAADGAGSAARALEGSQLACNAFWDAIIRYLQAGGAVTGITREVAQDLTHKIVDRLRYQAEAEGLELREFACTFLGALVGSNAAAFLQIGDGAIVVSESAGYRPVFWPQSGEYVNITHFVTDDEVDERLAFVVSDSPVDEVALLTDGLQALALRYATREAHIGFFLPLFERLRLEPEGEGESVKLELEAWLNSARVNERTDDDKTLILATRRPTERKPAGI